MPRAAFLFCGLALATICAPQTAQAQERSFNVPAQSANRAILVFARQAGIQIVAPGSRLRNLRTNGIKGRLDIRDALRAMLRGTGIQIVSDAGNTITLSVPPAASRERNRTARSPEAQDADQGGSGQSSALSRWGGWRANSATQVGTGYILVTGSRIKKDEIDTPVPGTIIDFRSERGSGVQQCRADRAVDTAEYRHPNRRDFRPAVLGRYRRSLRQSTRPQPDLRDTNAYAGEQPQVRADIGWRASRPQPHSVGSHWQGRGRNGRRIGSLRVGCCGRRGQHHPRQSV